MNGYSEDCKLYQNVTAKQMQQDQSDLTVFWLVPVSNNWIDIWQSSNNKHLDQDKYHIYTK